MQPLPVGAKFTAVDIDGHYHSVSATELSWRPSIYAIIVENGSVLLVPQVERGFDLPGGGIELGESFESAVVRETWEETGLHVASGPIVAVRESYFAWAPDRPDERAVFQAIMLYTSARILGGSLSTSGFDPREKHEATLAKWVPVDDLDTVRVASSVDYRPIVKAVARGGPTLS